MHLLVQVSRHTNKGKREGVGIYKVADGKLTYYQDYMNGLEG